MHFWIDKRSVCGQRRPHFVRSPCLYRPKPLHCPMVTPIHRFQRMESTQAEGRWNGSGRSYGCHSRRVESAPRSVMDDEEESVTVQTSDTVAANGPRDDMCLTQVNTTERDEASVYSMNLCVWVGVTLILLIMMLLPAHLYLKNSHYHIMLVGVFFVIILLFLMCFSVSLFHSKTRALLLQRLNLDDETRSGMESGAASPIRRSPIFSRAAQTQLHARSPQLRPLSPHQLSSSTPDLLINGQVGAPRDHISLQQPNQSLETSYSIIGTHGTPEHRSMMSPVPDASSDPPPYHIAILLPDPDQPTMRRETETPPPAYGHMQ